MNHHKYLIIKSPLKRIKQIIDLENDLPLIRLELFPYPFGAQYTRKTNLF